MDVLEKLPDPKIVGAAEYTLVHEYARELLDGGMDPVDVQHSMDEVSRWARRILVDITRQTNRY